MKIKIKGFEKEFENRFAFFSSQNPNKIFVEERQSPLDLIEALQKQFIIFTTEKIVNELLKIFEIPKENINENKNGRIIGIFIGNSYFKNFNEISNYSDLNSLKEDFNFPSSSEISIMKNYIDFLRKNKLRCNEIAYSTSSTICELVFYKKTGALFYIHNNNLPKTPKERKRVFKYFKNELIKENGKVYGVLFHKKGYYENVLRVDLNNFYGYQLLVKKFLNGNPHQVLNGKKEATYSYMPDGIRNAVLHNYKVSKEKGQPKGIRKFFKGCNNMTIGRSENLGIYLRRTRQSKRNFLQPQHGFSVILGGIKDLNSYIKVFQDYGGEIIKADTDGLAIVGLSNEVGEKLVKAINSIVVKKLLAAGLSEEDANCGIGQFKIEGYSKQYYQFGDKAYCFTTEKEKWEIVFSGMGKERKKEILKKSSNFEELIENLKNEKIKKMPTIIEWED